MDSFLGNVNEYDFIFSEFQNSDFIVLYPKLFSFSNLIFYENMKIPWIINLLTTDNM